MRAKVVTGLVALSAGAVLAALVVLRCGAGHQSSPAVPEKATKAEQTSVATEPDDRLDGTAGVAASASRHAGAGGRLPVAASPPRSASAGAGPGRRPAHVPKRRCVVAAIGDSLTDARSHGGGYLRELKRRCPQSQFDNFGRGGDMVNQMRRRFFGRVLVGGRSYTHIIVFGGVNDLYSDLTAGRTNDKIQRDLLAMYRASHDQGASVVAITVAPWGGFRRYFNARRGAATRALNQWIKGQVGEGNVERVVDAFSLLSCGAPDRLCDRFAAPFKDGLHFGPAGHRVLGEALYETCFHECL